MCVVYSCIFVSGKKKNGNFLIQSVGWLVFFISCLTLGLYEHLSCNSSSTVPRGRFILCNENQQLMTFFFFFFSSL